MRYIIPFLSMLAISGCTSPWYLGEWQVVDAKFPGISAMGMEEAREWFGSEVVYSESEVTFRDEVCNEPQFRMELLAEDDFHRLYRARFADLGIDGELAEVLRVDCPVNWTSPVSTLIKANRDTGYILWNGTFFELTPLSRSAHR